MLSVHCPNCGGTNIFDETKQIPTYCGFCSAHLPDMTTFVQESLKLGLDKQHHQMDLEKMDKQIKRERVNTSTTKLKIIVVGVMFVLWAIIMIMILNRAFH